jgi:RHS repeat-associated protein
VAWVSILWFNLLGIELRAQPTQEGETLRFFIRDHLGSVRKVVDEGGRLLEENEYSPQGGTLSNPGGYRFAGKEEDGFGFLEMGVRTYDSRLGRFLSKDPLYLMAPSAVANHAAELDLYGYARNNPTGFVDSNGLKARPVRNAEIARRMGNTVGILDCNARAVAILRDELGYTNPAIRGTSTGWAMFASMHGLQEKNPLRGMKPGFSYVESGAIRIRVDGNVKDRTVQLAALRNYMSLLKPGDVVHVSNDYYARWDGGSGHNVVGAVEASGLLYEARGVREDGQVTVKSYDFGELIRSMGPGEHLHLAFQKVGEFQAGSNAVLNPQGQTLQRTSEFRKP